MLPSLESANASAADARLPSLARRLIRGRKFWLRLAAGSLLFASCAAILSFAMRTYWTNACRSAQQEERWVDLERIAGRWAWWMPGSAEAWLYLADGVQHQHRYVEAAELLHRVPDDSEQYLQALQVRAQILCGPGNRPLQGEQACLELLELEPRATFAHETLIQYYALTLQRTKLRDHVRLAIRNRREPRDAYVYYFLSDTLRLANGVAMNERWLATDPDEELFLVAQVLHGNDATLANPDGEGAIQEDLAVRSQKEKDVLRLVQRFPANVNLLGYLIDMEIARGREARVLELLADAPKEAEQHAPFWRFQGWVHYVNGDQQSAETAYRRALEIVPMDWSAMTRLSESLRAQERLDEAAKLQEFTQRAQDLRARIRDAKEIARVPNDVLRDIGRLARDCGDDVIAEGIEYRLGSLEPNVPRPGEGNLPAYPRSFAPLRPGTGGALP